MFGKLKKLVRGSKGMEALQAVMLTGAGFLVVFGLMGLYSSNEKDIKNALKDLIAGSARGTTK